MVQASAQGRSLRRWGAATTGCIASWESWLNEGFLRYDFSLVLGWTAASQESLFILCVTPDDKTNRLAEITLEQIIRQAANNLVFLLIQPDIKMHLLHIPSSFVLLSSYCILLLLYHDVLHL
jgi:hypothetical protein